MNLSSCTSITPPDTYGFSSRTGLLLGEDGVARLAAASVAVFGLGGVGSFVVEALARAGVGRLLLVDADIVAESNQNGCDGIALIPLCPQEFLKIQRPHIIVLLIAYADTFDLSAFGYVADAIDSVPSKLELAARALAAGTPIISCMGAGNKLDPTLFRVADIAKTSVCPLCRTMRRQLRARGISHLTVVYSPEPPRAQPVQSACAANRCPVGSVSFVPAAAGLVLAGQIIRALSGVD